MLIARYINIPKNFLPTSKLRDTILGQNNTNKSIFRRHVTAGLPIPSYHIKSAAKITASYFMTSPINPK